MLSSKSHSDPGENQKKAVLKEWAPEEQREREQGLESYGLASEEAVVEIPYIKALSKGELEGFVRSIAGESCKAVLDSKDAAEKSRLFTGALAQADAAQLVGFLKSGLLLLQRCDTERLAKSGARYPLQEYEARASIAPDAARSLEVFTKQIPEIYAKDPAHVVTTFTQDVLYRLKNIPLDRTEAVMDRVDGARLTMIIALGPWLMEHDRAGAVTAILKNSLDSKQEQAAAKNNTEAEPEKEDLETRLAKKRERMFAGAKASAEADAKAEEDPEGAKVEEGPSELQLIEQSEIAGQSARLAYAKERVGILISSYGPMKNMALPDGEERAAWREALISKSEVASLVSDKELLNRYTTQKVNSLADSAMNWISTELKLLAVRGEPAVLERMKIKTAGAIERAEKYVKEAEVASRVYAVYAYTIKLALKGVAAAMDQMEKAGGVPLALEESERAEVDKLLGRRDIAKVIIPSQGVSLASVTRERAVQRAKEEEARKERNDPWGRHRKKGNTGSGLL